MRRGSSRRDGVDQLAQIKVVEYGLIIATIVIVVLLGVPRSDA
jgi:hypothetical protein